jgi:hypothetical protein
MWEKVKAFCLNSATMAVSYAVAAIGVVFQLIDATSYIYNSDDFKNWITAALGGDPVLLGRVMLAIAGLVALARLRGILGWGVKKDEDQP